MDSWLSLGEAQQQTGPRMDTNPQLRSAPTPQGGGAKPRVHPITRLIQLLPTAAMVAVLGSGCAAGGPARTDKSGVPRNVYAESGRIPAGVKRVAVLPLAIAENQAALEEGRNALQPILLTELLASARFEFVPVTPEQSRSWTGHAQWLTSDALPRELLDKVRTGTGAEAILFVQLTRYQPYPPVALGWRLQLLSAEPPRVLWAVDELFDAGDPPVAEAAREYYRAHWGNQPAADPGTILASPRRFGQYTAAAMVKTLPER